MGNRNLKQGASRHLAGFGTRPDAGADIKGLWLDETMLLWGRAWRAGV